MAKLVPLDHDQRKAFNFGTLKGVLSNEVIEAIQAPLPGDILDAMSSAPIEAGEGD